MSNTLMSNYARLPVQFSHGAGVWLWDENETQYLDALAGIAVCGLGHAHEKVTDAIYRQAQTLVHTSNLYGIQQQQALANKLTALSDLDNVFFANSGAEANEAAIKIARKLGNQRGLKTPQIIVMEGSFHGRTMATLSATGNPKVQIGFEPLVEGFIRVPYNDINAIKHVAQENDNIVAILVEPIQGEGGIQIPDVDYLPQIRQLCDEYNWLMMLDEIQTGIGRTGRWFAFQQHNILPDVMTLAKALGNGVPIGACLARGEAAQTLQASSHGSTFGGNPLACAAALAVLDTVETDALCQHAQTLGANLLSQFEQQLADVEGVVNIRGRGLMIGIELNQPCVALVQQALDKHLLINVTADRVIRLLPPLIMNQTQADQLVSILTNLIKNFLLNQGK